MAVRATDGEELRAEINVTPLVDVVLVLLVVFMVVTPLLKQELPIELPVAEHAGAADVASQVTLSATGDGRTLLDGVEVPREELLSRLRAIYADRPDKTIFLAADRDLPHGRVVDLLDDCRAAGVVRIGVITSKESAGERPGPPPAGSPAVGGGSTDRLADPGPRP